MKETKTSIYRKLETDVNEYKKRLIGNYTVENYNKLYETVIRKGIYSIDTWDIYRTYLLFDDCYRTQPSINKRASEIDIMKLTEYFDEIKRSDHEIVFMMRQRDNIGTTLRSVKLKEIDNKKYSFSKDLLSSTLPSLQAVYDELYKPREGYTACAYCGKQTKNEELYMAPIMKRERIYGVLRSTRVVLPFCSKQCAVNEQYANEG